MKLFLLTLLAFSQISCKVSLVSFDAGKGKAPIAKIPVIHSNEKKEKKEEVLTDDKINDWLKQEFQNIINNPYPL